MGSMLEFDEEATRQVEAAYTTPDLAEQRRIVMEHLDLQAGERVLDVGVGPGLLAAEIAAAVGPGGLVCGIDISDDMLSLAAKRPTDAGTAPIELRHGEATHIPYDADAFDAAVSTQVLEYVPDIPEALAELRRVLRPGGRLLVLDTDWDSIVWRSNDDERMRRVLGTWDQHLADPHLPRTLVSSLRHAGFDVARPVIVPLLNVGFDPNCFSANLVSVIARYVAGRDGWSDEAVQAWAADLRQLGVDYFFSLNRYVFQATNLA